MFAAMRVPRLLRPLAVRPGLTTGLLVTLLVFAVTPWSWRLSTKALIGWDAGVFTFLVLIARMMRRPTTADEMTRRSAKLDEGRGAVLWLSVAATVVALAAVAVEAALTRHDVGFRPALRVVLSAGTVGLAWLFMHTVFAIHYAHDFYGRAEDVRPADLVTDPGDPHARPRQRRAGLLFPGDDPTPDYWDFVHFAFVIGVANQTADVQIESKSIRRIVTWHGLLAFVFNTGIVALGVNLAASLF
jgi:uncharacterized membrane protein